MVASSDEGNCARKSAPKLGQYMKRAAHWLIGSYYGTAMCIEGSNWLKWKIGRLKKIRISPDVEP